MGTWASMALPTSPPLSATSRGSPLPSKDMQAWHQGSSLCRPCLLGPCLSCQPRGPSGPSPYLPSGFPLPETPFLTLSAFQTPTHPSGSSSSVPSSVKPLEELKGEAMVPPLGSCSWEMSATCVTGPCPMLV